MRRFLTLVSLLCLAIPAGITFSGCTRNPEANYCNGLGYGTKVTDVAAIDLEPKTTGVSLFFGKTQQLSTPKATTCKDDTVSVAGYTYGTSNQQLVDVSPTGNICAGTWNRNSGGSVADYTQCTAPDPLPSSKEGLPYATAYVTATASSVASNPVEVFVHAQTTDVSLVTSDSSGVIANKCYSQGVTASLDAQACYNAGGTQGNVLLCAPSTVVAKGSNVCPLPSGVTTVPACSKAIGVLAYTAATPSIASINSETNEITASMPGTTLITASVAGSAASAGYFSTCPPRIITITTSGGDTSESLSKGVTQTLVATAYDTNTTDYPASGSTPAGKQLSGLTFDFQSTNQAVTTVSSSGSITTSFPGQASIFAVCQPPNCNQAPTQMFGLNGTGLPLTSNHVAVSTSGTASSYLWFAAPGQSQYFVPVDLYTGAVGSSVWLPYMPNSMVMDPSGNNLYFGSATELMVYSASSNSSSYVDASVPGVVLAVSPDNSTLLINDQTRNTFYLYSATSKATIKSFGGVGYSAAWTPDSNTLYITGEAVQADGSLVSALFVYNNNTGLTTCKAGDSTCAGNFAGAKSLAVLAPGVGAYFSGSTATTSRTWCPKGTAGDPTTGKNSSLTYYPEGDSITTATDVLAVVPPPALTSTTAPISEHVLGAAYVSSAIKLYDFSLTVPTSQCSVSSALSTSGALSGTYTLGATSPTGVNQVLAAPDQTYSSSYLAFVTYAADSANTGAALPYLRPGASSTPSSVTLTGASSISAPVAGAFSRDYKSFFVSTAGDNQIHFVDTTSLTDTKQIAPKLPACAPSDSGCKLMTAPASGYVPATVILVKPRSTT